MLNKMIFIKNKDAACRIIESQAVILTTEDGRLHTLNEVGTFIWELLDGKRATEEITAKVSERFDVDKKMAKKDVNFFLGDIMRRHLLTVKKKFSK